VVPDCEVAHPLLAALIPHVRAEGVDEVVLRVSVATGGITALAVTSDDRPGRLHGLPATVAVGPDAFVHEEVAGHRFRVSSGSFFQSSPQGAELLVAQVVEAAGASATTAAYVVDLYAGVGLFAATVAPQARVVLVEQSSSSAADARVNLAEREAEVVEADVERWAAPLADLVVADPSRRGLDRGGVATVVSTGTPVLVLVSCDAAALGRDARLLAEVGYRHAGSTVLDVFPGTAHVEVVTRFERSTGRAS
jgi:23S rRNA (uracil1939-C5)-methyltransferase